MTYGVLGVPSEPDSGEMSPSELALNDVATILEGVADSDGVVAAAAVILGSFVLGREIAAVGPLLFRLVPHSPTKTPDRFGSPQRSKQ